MKRTILLTGILIIILFLSGWYAYKKSEGPGKGFLYVFQDNYAVVNLSHNSRRIKYLYSDGATSCIIFIVTGKNIKGEKLITLAHLSRPQGIKLFFKKVITAHYVGPVAIYIQGANPPSMKSAQLNTNAVFKSIVGQINNVKGKWYISSMSILLQKGDPLEKRRDSFGIDLNTMRISNWHFNLTMRDRDVSGGKQALYVSFGRKLNPPIWLRNAFKPFHQALMKRLIVKACQDHEYIHALNMSADKILNDFSTTPNDEVPWFNQLIVVGSQYANAHGC